MSALVTPPDAVAAVRGKLGQRWAEAVCAEFGVGDRVVFSVRLRPGVRTGKAVEQPCWRENHGVAIRTPARRAAWHADCPNPIRCSCPAHDTDQSRPIPPAPR